MNKRIVFGASLAMALVLMPRTSRARWMNVNTGRFQTMDSYEGSQEEPQSLHRYTYTQDDPVNGIDPSGEDDISGVLASIDIMGELGAIGVLGAQVEVRAQTAATGRPSSRTFWAKYLNYNDYTQQEVWKKVGGKLGEWGGTTSPAHPTGQNSCATRVSYGLNYGGAPIPSGTHGAYGRNYKASNGTGDDLTYITSASAMNSYLKHTWGAADVKAEKILNPPDIDTVINTLINDQCAIFATRNGEGHSGVLKKGYNDPYVHEEGEIKQQMDVWKLSP